MSDSKTKNRQFEIHGRYKPSEKKPNPEVFRMKLFAPNAVVARSRFWYYLGMLKKIKRANGEVVQCTEIFEKKPTSIKNYGIWLRYDSRSGSHNMYKEFRALTLNQAVDALYANMASLHRSRRSNIQIVRTAVVKAGDCKRAHITEYHNSKIAFRLLHRVPRRSAKEFRKPFSATKPSAFF